MGKRDFTSQVKTKEPHFYKNGLMVNTAKVALNKNKTMFSALTFAKLQIKDKKGKK